MHTYKLLFATCLLFATGILINSCIDPLEFPSAGEGERLLVVDGKLDASNGQQILRLSESNTVGRSANFPPITGAHATISDNLGNSVSYVETEPGIYKLNGSDIQATPGRTYTLKINYNGKNYESVPETMPDVFRADSSSFVVANQRFVYINSHLTIPQDFGSGPYLKWRIDNVYQLGEIYCYPLEPVLVCYVQEYFGNQLLPLLDGSQFTRGEPLQHFITRKEGDKTFGEVMFFNVYMESLSQEAFSYWSKVALLLTQTGSFFDAPPSAIRGNIVNTDNPKELVLGYFYTAPEDTTHVKVIASDFLPYQVNPYCGVPGFPTFPFPSECCNCTRVPGASLTRPPYWR